MFYIYIEYNQRNRYSLLRDAEENSNWSDFNVVPVEVKSDIVLHWSDVTIWREIAEVPDFSVRLRHYDALNLKVKPFRYCVLVIVTSWT